MRYLTVSCWQTNKVDVLRLPIAFACDISMFIFEMKPPTVLCCASKLDGVPIRYNHKIRNAARKIYAQSVRWAIQIDSLSLMQPGRIALL